MSVLRIPCPHCRKVLKVKDPALLGRKAKCPACDHRFVLESKAEEDDVPIARAAAANPIPTEKRSAAGSKPIIELPAEPPVPTINVEPTAAVERLKARQAAARRRRNTLLIGAAFGLGLLIGGFFVARPYLPQNGPVTEVPATNPPPIAVATSTDNTPAGVAATGGVPFSPTQGEPITLRMVPSGARLIVNLRPAQLWSDDPQMVELRGSLTQDVTGWLEAQLRDICRHEPAQVEEVLLAWILGSRGTKPELAAVVHLVEDARMSDLLEEFGSDAIDELAQPKVYKKGEQATLILDTKTFAIAPLAYGRELADWVDVPNLNTSDGIVDLLPLTDRQRLVTVLFEPADLDRHLEHLVGEAVRPLLGQVAEWFATDAETVCWSLNTGDEFYSELLVHGPRTTSPVTTESHLKQRMEAVPPMMVELIRKMRPQRSGFRRLIGRFPAMLEVSRRATISTLKGRAVKLVTVMPPKAAPNLALATVLTWDESLRTNFSVDAPTMAQTKPKLPETVVGRLQLPVDAEFNRVPLYEALDYIAGEIQVKVEIDGDALKDAGFTKNMAQTFTLGRVPAAQTLAHIVSQYNEPGKQLVIVVDEPSKTLIVTTRKFADQQGRTVHEFGP